MISYTSAIIDVLLGTSRTNSPFADLNVHSENPINYSMIISNNQVEDDRNLYELKVESKEQFDSLKALMELESRALSHLVKNHYTVSGQYLEIIYKDQLIKLHIGVGSMKMSQKPLAC